MGQLRATTVFLVASIITLSGMGVAVAQSRQSTAQKAPQQSSPPRQPSFPALTGRVVDAANLLAPEDRARLEAKLKAHQEKTSDQVVVTTVPSLGELSVENYANKLFNFWRLGQKDKNNGVLLLVAPKEDKVRIEVGYSLEGVLTDAASGRILNSAVLPKFKHGDFAGGIEAGVDQMLATLQRPQAQDVANVRYEQIYTDCGKEWEAASPIATCLLEKEKQYGKELERLYQRLLKSAAVDVAILRRQQRNWLKYQRQHRDSYYDLEANEGPSIARLSSARCLLRTTLQRIDELHEPLA